MKLGYKLEDKDTRYDTYQNTKDIKLGYKSKYKNINYDTDRDTKDKNFRKNKQKKDKKLIND